MRLVSIVKIMKHPSELKATILIAISAVLYGFLAFLGTQLVRNQFSIENMLFWRFLIAGLWMLGSYLIQKRKAILTALPKLRISVRIFILGAICYSGSCGFYFLAARYTGTGIAMVIFFAYPMLVALFAWLLDRNSLNIVLVLSLIAMLVGLYLLKGENQHPLSILGIIYGLLAAASYALYVFGSRNTAGTVDSALSTIIVCFGCMSAFLVMTLFSHTLQCPVTGADWFYALALGILATAIPIQLMLEGLRSVSPVRASVISVLEPLLTVILGVVLLSETLSWSQILGCVITLISALVIQFQRVRVSV